MTSLMGFEDRYPHELSGGMRQRVGIARALTTDPKALLMDEPFGALDAQTRGNLQDELLQIWQKQRTTVLFVTHSIDEALLLADRILVFTPRPGRIAADIEVDLPRPRAPQSAEFSALARELRGLVGADARSTEINPGETMPFAKTDDGVKLYYEEIGAGRAGRVRARVRRRPSLVGNADAPFRPALSLHHLERARLSAVRRAGEGRRATARTAPPTTSPR